MDKNIYINDLLSRYPAHTFEETTVDSMTLVVFKDGESEIIAESQALVVADAYKAIRLNILEGQDPLFISTSAERNALVNVEDGTTIYNTNTKRVESYEDNNWAGAGGSGIMSDTAYGSMFEDSSTGSAMNSTTKQWITANSGVFDGNGLITFLNDADGDRLVVGEDGSGDYIVVASCGQTNSGSNRTTMNVHINGVDSSVVKDDQNASDTNHRALVANGILTLADDDYLTMHIVDPDTASNEIKVFDCHLTIQRIS